MCPGVARIPPRIAEGSGDALAPKAGDCRKDYVEAPYADLRRPRISLAEQRAVCKMLRAEGQRALTEERLFEAIETQRAIVRRALADTRRVRREDRKSTGQGRGARVRATPTAGAAWNPPPEPADTSGEVDYSKPAPPYPVELW